jgi:hypothetical protein
MTEDRPAAPSAFVCPLCERRSYHPKDIEHRFCAACGFVDDVLLARGLSTTTPGS